MSEVLTGGCLCGATRYRSGPPIGPATLCHCTSCRRASGAHALGWVTVATATFEWLSPPQRRASSPGVERTYCASCGTPLSWRRVDAADIDVTIGSLDAPHAHPPADHTWMEDALPWDRPSDGLPQYRRARET